VSVVNQFIAEEIVQRLPSLVEVENMRNKIDERLLSPQKDEHSYLMDMIAADIRKGTKDPFVTEMLSTQIVSNHIFK
jgi:hypothetical protein